MSRAATEFFLILVLILMEAKSVKRCLLINYLRFQHDLGQLLPLLRRETCLLELLEAVGEPLSLLLAAQLTGLHGQVAAVGCFQVGLNFFQRSLCPFKVS